MQMIRLADRPSPAYRNVFHLHVHSSPYQDAKVMEMVDDLIKEMSEKQAELIQQVYEGKLPEKTVMDKLDRILETRQIPDFVSCKLLKKLLGDKLFGYGILQPLIDDPHVTDIFVNDYKTILKRVNGEDIPVMLRFKSEEELEDYFRSILTRVRARVNRSEPIVDSRDMKYQLRINGAIKPVVKTTYFTIRKHRTDEFTMKDLVRFNTLSDTLARELEKYVGSWLNILISGPTGSGKTTLLRGMTEYIHPLERIVVLEEEAELQIWHRNIVSMETKKGAGDSECEIDLDDLVRNAMRMSPRRIILGELRGKEALNLLRAFGTGHDGGLTTIHANDVQASLRQLAFLMLYAGTPLDWHQIMSMISETVDMVIHIARHRVVEVAEVQGYSPFDGNIKTHTLWKWEVDPGTERGSYMRAEPSDDLRRKMAFRRAMRKRSS